MQKNIDPASICKSRRANSIWSLEFSSRVAWPIFSSSATLKLIHSLEPNPSQLLNSPFNSLHFGPVPFWALRREENGNEQQIVFTKIRIHHPSVRPSVCLSVCLLVGQQRCRILKGVGPAARQSPPNSTTSMDWDKNAKNDRTTTFFETRFPKLTVVCWSMFISKKRFLVVYPPGILIYCRTLHRILREITPNEDG